MVRGLAGKDKILFKAGVAVESPCTVHIFWHFRFTGHAVHSTNNQYVELVIHVRNVAKSNF